MDELHSLTQAGCSFFDLNHESWEKVDWSKTPLGPRDGWPTPLTSYVNLLATFPHPSAVFWGNGKDDELTTVYNLSFGKLSCDADLQGMSAEDCLSEDGTKALQRCLNGRTIKVESASFLAHAPKKAVNTPTVLSPLFMENGKICGVLAQLLPYQHEVAGGAGDCDVLEDEDDEEDSLQQLDKGEKNESSLNLKENKLFQKFAQMLPTGLAILDSDAEALFVNREFYRLTSNTNHDLGNFRCWPESIHSEDYNKVMDAYRKAFESTEPLRVEFRCAEGPDHPWRLFMMRSLTEQPDKGGFICAVIDVSEIKAAELAQRNAAQQAKERKEQQERFIDMISHEIRNPLSAVLHSAEEIKECVIRSKQAGVVENIVADIVDAVDTILLCVAHQSTLVDDILSFSKLDAMMLSLNPKKTQPKLAFAEALKLFQPELRAKKISFNYALDVSFADEKVDWVLADMKRIKQILVNLVTNAIKFTAKAKGERNILVAIGAARKRPTSYPPNVVFFESDESYRADSTLTSKWGSKGVVYIMVAIKDTGIGITKEDQKKLFERFRQATPKTQETYGGSGLGLFISRKLCQLHGGDIGVSSKEGSGSTFAFFFKVRRSEVPAKEEGQDVAEECSSLSVRASEMLSNTTTGESSIVDAQGAIKEGISTEVDGMANQLRQRNLVNVTVLDSEDDMECLKNPEVKVVAEAHPAFQDGDERYEITNKIASTMEEEAKSDEKPDSKSEPKPDDKSETKPNDDPTGSSSHDEDEKGKTISDHELKSGKGHEHTDIPNQDDGEFEAAIGGDTVILESTLATQDHRTHDACSVLLVEDNQINQKVLSKQLRSRGFLVTAANHGQEAVDLCKDRAELCIVLMDQEMPVMDGNTATKAIRNFEKSKRNAKHVPILGVSANVRSEQKDAMIQAGMDETISKPFKVDDLVHRIKQMLHTA